MRNPLKISSFIIFAATVASAFTSCGNESELFEEPVMYQTRAMGGIDTRMESGYPKFEISGNHELSEKQELRHKTSHKIIGQAYTDFTWIEGKDARNSDNIDVPKVCKVELDDTACVVIKRQLIPYSDQYNSNRLEATYHIIIKKDGEEIHNQNVTFVKNNVFGIFE